MARRSTSWWASGVLTALLVAWLSPVPTSASPTWLPAATISGVDRPSTSHVVVSADGAGNVTALWQSDLLGFIQVLAASHTAVGSWSEPVPLAAENDDASRPALDTDAHGVVTAVWLNFDGAYSIQSATRSLDGTWSGATTIGVATSESVPKVAVSNDGHATATWSRSMGGFDVVQAAMRTPGGTWAAADPVSETGQNALRPDVDVHRRSGTAVLVWDRSDGTHTVVQMSQRSPGSPDWNNPLDMSDNGQNATDAHVVVANIGQMTIAWTRFDGAKQRVQAIWNFSDGIWAGVQTLSASGEDAFDMRMAVDPANEVTVIWRRYNGAVFVVQAISRVLEHAWGPVIPLSDPTDPAMYPNVAADPTGGAVATWFSQGDTWEAHAARREAGAWGTATPMGGDAWPFEAPGVAVDSAGDAVVVWAETFAQPVRVRARALDVAGPRLTTFSVPRPRAGRAAPFRATAIDSWSSVASYRWRFGDGTQANGPNVKHTYAKTGRYRVSLVVRDTHGNTTTRKTKLYVRPPRPVIRVFELTDPRIDVGETTRLRVKLNTTAGVKVVLLGKAHGVRAVISRKLPRGISTITIGTMVGAKRLVPDTYVVTGRASNISGTSPRQQTKLLVTRS